MSDLRLAWDGFSFAGDLSIEANDIAIDDGLETAVILSLGTDKRAEDWDTLPDGQSDRRGWWGDVLPPTQGDRIGSRLWLLGREKEQAIVLERAKEYAADALKWMTDDKLAERIDVSAEFTRPGMLGLLITIYRPLTDPVEFQFNYTWAAQAARG